MSKSDDDARTGSDAAGKKSCEDQPLVPLDGNFLNSQAACVGARAANCYAVGSAIALASGLSPAQKAKLLGHLASHCAPAPDPLPSTSSSSNPLRRRYSPLVLDLDGDGVETSDYAGLFDHDANGFATLTKWVGQDDGLLVWDRNGDGVINDGTEVFGNHTPLRSGQTASNGFEALQELDSNDDGVVNSQDDHWEDLRIWRFKPAPVPEGGTEGAGSEGDSEASEEVEDPMPEPEHLLALLRQHEQGEHKPARAPDTR